MNEKTNSQKRAILAQEICNSEAFARLMVGSSTIDRELNDLRDMWKQYLEVNGGYGRGRARNEEAKP